MSYNYDQGLGFSENTGYWPMPDARSGIIRIIDDNDQPHVLILDSRDGLIYDISMRDGPTGSTVKRHYTDRVAIDDTEGYDIEPEVEFKEDTGEYERFVVEHNASRFYVRPDDESKRNADGRDSLGYLDGIKFTSEVYVDGEPNTATASAKRIPNNGEIVYDKVVEGNRIYSKFKGSRSGFSLIKRQQEYIVKDINYNFQSRELHEGDCQEAISNIINRSTRSNPLIDRMTKVGIGLTGYTDNTLTTPATITRSLTSGADGGNNTAIKLSGGYAKLFEVSNEVGYTDERLLFLWIKSDFVINTATLLTPNYTYVPVYGVGAYVESDPGTINDYRLYIAKISVSGDFDLYINATSEISIFDARLCKVDSSIYNTNGTPYLGDVITYMYKDGNNNTFNNICPTIY